MQIKLSAPFSPLICVFTPLMTPSRPIWDLFCRVIDNHGDLGVAVRLARQLAQHGHGVRLWVDEPSALTWMAPDLAQLPLAGNHPAATWPADHGIRVLPWSAASDAECLRNLAPATVWAELFGCELPEAFVAHGAAHAHTPAQRPVWLNLEYLSAEAYVARSHGLPSHIGAGPATSWTKWFFYPGFTPDTGGLLRAGPDAPAGAAIEDPSGPGDQPARVRTTLFCYEPPGLQPWLAAMQDPSALPLDWLVMPGRPTHFFAQALALPSQPEPSSAFAPIAGTPHRFRLLPHMTQPAFDATLAAADINFVRGEDSLVSGLRSGKPLIWHIYPQDDQAHHDKLRAFLQWLDAPPTLVDMHLSWNGLHAKAPPVLTAAVLAEWQACFAAASSRLANQADLVQQLLAFVQAKQAGARKSSV